MNIRRVRELAREILNETESAFQVAPTRVPSIEPEPLDAPEPTEDPPGDLGGSLKYPIKFTVNGTRHDLELEDGDTIQRGPVEVFRRGYVFGFWNRSAHAGTVELTAVTPSSYPAFDRVRVYPGGCFAVVEDEVVGPSIPGGRPEAADQLDEAIGGAENFWWDEETNIPLFGPKDINGPGGWLVYPYIEYWLGLPGGFEYALMALVGLANRTPVWRHNHTHQGKGYGGLAVDSLPGYPILQPWKVIDYAHLGRVYNLAFPLAPYSTFAREFLDNLYKDLLAAWVEEPDKKKANKLKWTAEQLAEHYWAEGCPEFGRGFGHSLNFAARYAQLTGDTVLMDALLEAVAVAISDYGWIYAIPPSDGRWEKKIKTKMDPDDPDTMLWGQEVLALEDPPALRVSFEEQITLLGLTEAAKVPGFEDWSQDLLGKVQKSLGPFPAEITFEGRRDLDYPKTTPWGHCLPPFLDLGGLDPIQQISSYPIGDGAGGAIHPSLYPR